MSDRLISAERLKEHFRREIEGAAERTGGIAELLKPLLVEAFCSEVNKQPTVVVISEETHRVEAREEAGHGDT